MEAVEFFGVWQVTELVSATRAAKPTDLVVAVRFWILPVDHEAAFCPAGCSVALWCDSQGHSSTLSRFTTNKRKENVRARSDISGVAAIMASRLTSSNRGSNRRGQRRITSTNGSDVTPESGSSTRSR
jgi:hypothetical protein